MYTGDSDASGVYSYTFAAEQKPDCPVCGNLAQDITIDPEMTLEDFIASLAERAEAQLKKPTIRTEARSLYYQAPKALEEQTRPNLEKKMKELVSDGEEIAVSDQAFMIDFKFRLNYKS